MTKTAEPGIHPDLQALAVPVGDLKLLPGNPRVGDVDAVARSYAEFGQRKTIVATRDGTVIDGNHQLQAARQLGWTHIAVTFTDDDDIRARAYALAANRTGDLGGYDDDLLVEMLSYVADDADLLAAAAYSQEDIDRLIDGIEHLPTEDADNTGGPPPAVPRTVPGDLWILGPHKLLSGDSSEPSAVDRLIAGERIGCVLTDPPYGMNLDTDYSKMPGGNANSKMNKQPIKYRKVEGDDEAFDASFLRTYFGEVREQFWFGADYYRSSLSDNDRDGSWLIWDKRNEEQDDVIGSGFETIWSAQPHQRRLLRHYWCGAFGKPEARERFHPTQKPIGLLADILTRWAPAGCTVADLYGGSGSVLLACEDTRRQARLIELDPGYCDVIARRYQTHTGQLPILEATGEAHDFTQDT